MFDFPPTKYWCFPYRSGNCTSQTKSGFSTQTQQSRDAWIPGDATFVCIFIAVIATTQLQLLGSKTWENESVLLWATQQSENFTSWTISSWAAEKKLNGQKSIQKDTTWWLMLQLQQETHNFQAFPRRHKLFEKHQRQRHLCIYWPWIPGVKFHVSDILRYSFEVSEVHLIDIACRLCDGFGETAVVAAPLKEAVRGRAAGGVAAFSLGGRRHLLCLEDLGGIGLQDCSAVQALKLLPGLVDVFKALAFWEMWQPGAKMRQRIFSIFSPVSLIIIVSCRSMTSFASFMQMFNVLSF